MPRVDVMSSARKTIRREKGVEAHTRAAASPARAVTDLARASDCVTADVPRERRRAPLERSCDCRYLFVMTLAEHLRSSPAPHRLVRPRVDSPGPRPRSKSATKVGDSDDTCRGSRLEALCRWRRSRNDGLAARAVLPELCAARSSTLMTGNARASQHRPGVAIYTSGKRRPER